MAFGWAPQATQTSLFAGSDAEYSSLYGKLFSLVAFTPEKKLKTIA